MNKITYGAELEAKMRKRLDELCKCARTSGDAVMGNFAGGYERMYHLTRYARLAGKEIGKYDLSLINHDYRLSYHITGSKFESAFREGMEEAMSAMGLVAYEDPELFGIQVGYPKKEAKAA